MTLNDTTFDIDTVSAVGGQGIIRNEPQIKFGSPFSPTSKMRHMAQAAADQA